MTKATKEPEDLVLEHLKRIQGSQSEMRNTMTDMRGDIRDIKVEIVSLRTIMGEFIKTDARRESEHLALEIRMDRIERRLDLQETPPT